MKYCKQIALPMAIATVFWLLPGTAAGGWPRFYYKYHYQTTYSQTYQHTGYAQSTSPGSDSRYDAPYNTLVNANAFNRISDLQTKNQAIQRVTSTYNNMSYLTQRARSTSQQAAKLDKDLTDIKKTLTDKNNDAVSQAQSIQRQASQSAQSTVASWRAMVSERINAVYSNPSTGGRDSSRFDTPDDVKVWDRQNAEQEDGLKPNAIAFRQCAYERGAYGYWNGSTFVRADPQNSQCLMGRCRCEKFM